MKIITDLVKLISGKDYLKFLLVLVITLIISFLAKLIVKKLLKPLAEKTKTKLDDLVLKSLSSIIFYIIFIIGFRIGLQYFELKPAISNILNSLIVSFLVIIISVFFIKIINNFSQQWAKEWKFKTKTTTDERIIPLLKRILKAVVIILAVFFVFDAWKINISPLLATAGIAGIAISFAVRDSLSNILGGLQLVLDKTFKVGDKVEIESGETGVILDVGLRSTKLKTYDNEVIHIPNGSMANAKIKNFTQPDFSIRVNVNFGVEYGSDSEKVRQVVLETIKKIDTVLKEPQPVVLFLNMSDFSLDFVARAWVKSYTEAYSTKLKMTDEIYRALNKANIGIPFPTHTVYTKKID